MTTTLFIVNAAVTFGPLVFHESTSRSFRPKATSCTLRIYLSSYPDVLKLLVTFLPLWKGQVDTANCHQLTDGINRLSHPLDADN